MSLFRESHSLAALHTLLPLLFLFLSFSFLAVLRLFPTESFFSTILSPLPLYTVIPFRTSYFPAAPLPSASYILRNFSSLLSLPGIPLYSAFCISGQLFLSAHLRSSFGYFINYWRGARGYFYLIVILVLSCLLYSEEKSLISLFVRDVLYVKNPMLEYPTLFQYALLQAVTFL